MSELIGLRDDVYRRPLATALDRLGLESGWCCVDVGAGGGDVTVALAEMVGMGGRIYAVDSDPQRRDEVARAAAAHAQAQVVALTRRVRISCCPSKWIWPSADSSCSMSTPLGRRAPHGLGGEARLVGRGPRADHLAGRIGAPPCPCLTRDTKTSGHGCPHCSVTPGSR